MVITKSNKLLRAFTLVEILLVSTIIGVITIFTVVTGPVQLQKARDAVRKSNIDRIKKAIEEYHEDVSCYPQTIPSCTNKLVNGDMVLLNEIPCDPKGKLSYTYVPEVSDCPSWYQLYGNLEYTNDSIIDKIICRQGCGPNCQFNYGVSSPNQTLNPFCDSELTGGEATPGPSLPTETQDQYVCTQNGTCEIFANPELSGCPDVYLNDPTCQSMCTEKENWCHDARGKTN